MIEKHPPKFCPECGGTKISTVPCWHKSNWMADPKNPDWIPFQGTSYDTWCRDCEAGFDIAPEKEMEIYWYDEYPEDLPEGGNKHYTDVLLRRNPLDECCSTCHHFFSGSTKTDRDKYYRLETYCELDRTQKIRYFRPCIFKPSKWEKSGLPAKDEEVNK